MRLPWYFVLPKERSQPSGGNIYNERIIQALRQAEQSVEIISANDYLRAIYQGQSGTYWVDTLILESIREVLLLQPFRARSLLIAHHLESLAPPAGQSAKDLRAKEKPWLDWFQGFLATSHFTKAYLLEQRVSQSIIVAEPGTDISANNIPDRDTTTIRVLIVANLVERKGILPWLKWLAKNLKDRDQFSLTIVGRTDIEPAYAQYCQSTIENHPMLRKQLRLVGSQPSHQMAAFYQKSNLFISVASMETFGMALQEARMYRLPILALEGGYSAHHVEAGDNGYVFNNVLSLGDFFLNLIREPAKFTTLYQRTQQDSVTYSSWSQTARSLVQQFDQFFRYAP